MNNWTRTERAVWLILWAITFGLPLGLILAAPVMREPSHTISATDYFGDAQ